MDGDVGAAGAFEEGAEDAGGDVAAAADGDHEVGLEGGEDLGGGGLTQFVDLGGGALALYIFFEFGGNVNWWGRGVGGVDYLVVGHVDLFHHF